MRRDFSEGIDMKPSRYTYHIQIYKVTHIRLFIIFIFLFIFIVISICFANSSYYSQDGHFKVNIPKGWEKIPDYELTNFEKNIEQQFNKREDYHVAFQKKNNANWFSYPYILIQLDNRGSQYSKYQINKGLKKNTINSSVTKRKKEFADVLLDFDLNSVWYDADRKIVYTKTEFYKVNIGKMHGVLAQVLCSYGAVRVMFYDSERSFIKYYPDFETLLFSLIMDSGYEYKELETDHPFLGKGLENAIGSFILVIIVGIVVALFTIVVSLFRKKQSSKVNMKQCPSCHAFQDARKKECPNCGYALTNVQIYS